MRMTESAAPVVLAALPYAERQLIVVVDDELVAAEREAERRAELGDDEASSVEIAKVAALAIAPGSRWRAGRASESRGSLDSRGTWSLLRSRRRWQLLALETLVSTF